MVAGTVTARGTVLPGYPKVCKATAAASLVVSSGSTLGTLSGVDAWLFVYALDNSGTIELAISKTFFGEAFIGSTTAEGGAGGADTAGTIYSTTARSSVAMVLLAAIRSNQTTAGTWAAVPVECRLGTQGGTGTGLGMHRMFESAEQAIVGSSTLNVAHGLGVRPSLFKATLRCSTGELGFLAGDEIELPTIYPGSFVSGVVADATNVSVMLYLAAITVPHRGTQAPTGIDITKWKIVVRAWA